MRSTTEQASPAVLCAAAAVPAAAAAYVAAAPCNQNRRLPFVNVCQYIAVLMAADRNRADGVVRTWEDQRPSRENRHKHARWAIIVSWEAQLITLDALDGDLGTEFGLWRSPCCQ